MELQLQVTTPDKETALQIARKVVEAKLAACVQMNGPIQSIYRWQGKVEQEEEWLLLIKTTEERYALLEEKIADYHPYEVPQIIAVEVKHALPAYRIWVREQTADQ